MGLIPNYVKSSSLYQTLQRLLRVLQFVSATISLGLFSARIYKMLQLARHTATSNSAVQGILVAAVTYTLTGLLMKLFLKRSRPNILWWALTALDVAFVSPFIVVVLRTRPEGGASSRNGSKSRQLIALILNKNTNSVTNCNMPWGTFFLAIVSTYVSRKTYYNYLYPFFTIRRFLFRTRALMRVLA